MSSVETTAGNKNWYIVKTNSQYERKVKGLLEKAVANLWPKEEDRKISRIVVPCEEVVEVRKNKKSVRERPYYMGYMFVEMEMNEETYWVIRNIPGVSGFLGGSTPQSLSEDEKKNFIDSLDKPHQAKPRMSVTYEKGESVRINDGPFTHFVGVVEETNEERGKLKIMVTVFGRQTPVELDFMQVERV